MSYQNQFVTLGNSLFVGVNMSLKIAKHIQHFGKTQQPPVTRESKRDTILSKREILKLQPGMDIIQS